MVTTLLITKKIDVDDETQSIFRGNRFESKMDGREICFSDIEIYSFISHFKVFIFLYKVYLSIFHFFYFFLLYELFMVMI